MGAQEEVRLEGGTEDDVSTVDPCFIIQLIRALIPRSGTAEASVRGTGGQGGNNAQDARQDGPAEPSDSGAGTAEAEGREREGGARLDGRKEILPEYAEQQQQQQQQQEVEEIQSHREAAVRWDLGGANQSGTSGDAAWENESTAGAEVFQLGMTSPAEEAAVEEAGCILWDLSITEEHALFMVESHLISVSLAVLTSPSTSSRRKELCSGILANIACHDTAASALLSSPGALRSVLNLLSLDDPPCLTEACRLLRACLRSQGGASAWEQALQGEDREEPVLQRLVWIAGNTLHRPLLVRALELLSALLESSAPSSATAPPDGTLGWQQPCGAGSSRKGLSLGEAALVPQRLPSGGEGEGVAAAVPAPSSAAAAPEPYPAADEALEEEACPCLGTPSVMLRCGLVGLLEDVVASELGQGSPELEDPREQGQPQTQSLAALPAPAEVAMDIAELLSVEDKAPLPHEDRARLLNVGLRCILAFGDSGARGSSGGPPPFVHIGANALVVAANLLSSHADLFTYAAGLADALLPALARLLPLLADGDPARCALWTVLQSLCRSAAHALGGERHCPAPGGGPQGHILAAGCGALKPYADGAGARAWMLSVLAATPAGEAAGRTALAEGNSGLVCLREGQVFESVLRGVIGLSMSQESVVEAMGRCTGETALGARTQQEEDEEERVAWSELKLMRSSVLALVDLLGLLSKLEARNEADQERVDSFRQVLLSHFDCST